MPDVRKISAAETRPLRHKILRPQATPEQLVYPNDEEARAAHFGGFDNGELVAVISIAPGKMPGNDNPHSWRLRGVATDPKAQRKGFGRALLEACLEHARSYGGEILWCNGRTTAWNFYEALGFEKYGEEFIESTTGPHYVMWRKI